MYAGNLTLKSRSIPYYIFISPEGKIIKTWGGYGKGSLITKIKELLGE